MQPSWIRDDENLRSVILILSDMCLSLFFSIHYISMCDLVNINYCDY